MPDVLPSALAALGVRGFADTIGFGSCRSVLVLLVDGMGWDLLRSHAADAPFLASLATAPPLTAGFPTTTTTSIASLGTGRASGEHGMVGYTFAGLPGELLHPLSWCARDAAGQRRDVLAEWPPERAQPLPTAFELAAEAGVDARIAVPEEFRGTGLTRAALRGAQLRGVRAAGDLAAELLSATRTARPALCYGYHGHLDLLGHVHGPGSEPWRLQLAQVDRLVEGIAQRLPSAAVLAVVADHGMVPMPSSALIDVDAEPELLSGVRLLGGESRARHVYAEPGAADEVLDRWRERIGSAGAVLSGVEAVERGWFGPVVPGRVRSRVGDVLAVLREGGVVRSVVEPNESKLLGQHGSLTAAEQYVPALLVSG
nr:alkaline phosphatase family protein [Saccharopolyspora sp. HNM0983]